jgi:hypothetical protein
MQARQNILNKFRAKPGPDDPEVQRRQAEREAQAAARAKAREAKEAAKAEQKRLEAEAAAAEAARIAREKEEEAARQAALEAEQKAKRARISSFPIATGIKSPVQNCAPGNLSRASWMRNGTSWVGASFASSRRDDAFSSSSYRRLFSCRPSPCHRAS